METQATPKLNTFLVEDNELIRDGLIGALEELSPVEVVATAPDERAALEWLRQHHCDLVVVDIFLKGGSGIGVLRKALSSNSEAKFVVLSNYATPDVRARCLALGASEVFDKSNDVERLIAYCRNAAQAGQTPSAGEARFQQPPARASRSDSHTPR